MELSRRDAIRESSTRGSWVVSYVLRSGFVALVLAGCMGDDWPAPPPVSFDEFAEEHQEWRENRRERLVRPFSGVVLWMGLWELAQGATPFGSDPDLRIVLPEEDSPLLAGTIHRSGQEIRLAPSAGSPLTIRKGERITEMTVLQSDRSGNTTNLALGSLGMRSTESRVPTASGSASGTRTPQSVRRSSCPSHTLSTPSGVSRPSSSPTRSRGRSGFRT